MIINDIWVLIWDVFPSKPPLLDKQEITLLIKEAACSWLEESTSSSWKRKPWQEPFFLHEWPLFSTILTKTFSKLPSWGMKPTKDEGIQVKISVVMASYGLCSIWKIQLSPSLPLLADPVRDTCPGQAIAEQLLQLEFVKKKWALVVLVCSCGMYLIVF